jgi:hypothetical protein
MMSGIDWDVQGESHTSQGKVPRLALLLAIGNLHTLSCGIHLTDEVVNWYICSRVLVEYASFVLLILFFFKQPDINKIE